MTDQQTPRSATLPAGYDESDPYADESIEELPEWWRENVEHFRSYKMRPYRPPRFADGAFTPPVIEDLEAETGTTIELRAVDPDVHSDWQIVVDGQRVGPIGRERTGDGYTQYGMTESEFRTVVRSAIDDIDS